MSSIDTGNTAFMLVSMALVNLMTPGLAFFYGGLVRQGNVITIMIQNFAAMGLVTIIWVAWGFSLCFGSSGGFLGDPSSFYFMHNVGGQPLPHQGEGREGEAFVDGIPGLLFCGYQGMFAVITPALMTGAFADRMRFGPYLVFIFLWVHLVYFPFCHWVWGPDGWLAEMDVVDFAGGIVVHITAGFSALASVYALPSREKFEGKEVDKVPHNVPYVALGTALLWFGWFGFNAGSALSAGEVAAYAALNSEISASISLFVWMLIEWKLSGKPTLVGLCVGAIAGLATITPAAGFVQPWGACIIGLLAAPFCYSCVALTIKLGLDDSLDVWGVHGMGGFLGTILIGAFADENVNGVQASWRQFGIQLGAACFCAVYSYVVGFLIIKAIGMFTHLTPEEHLDSSTYQLGGLDASMHGLSAYVLDLPASPTKAKNITEIDVCSDSDESGNGDMGDTTNDVENSSPNSAAENIELSETKIASRKPNQVC